MIMTNLEKANQVSWEVTPPQPAQGTYPAPPRATLSRGPPGADGLHPAEPRCCTHRSTPSILDVCPRKWDGAARLLGWGALPRGGALFGFALWLLQTSPVGPLVPCWAGGGQWCGWASARLRFGCWSRRLSAPASRRRFRARPPTPR